jgi:hypothetical protein
MDCLRSVTDDAYFARLGVSGAFLGYGSQFILLVFHELKGVVGEPHKIMLQPTLSAVPSSLNFKNIHMSRFCFLLFTSPGYRCENIPSASGVPMKAGNELTR